MKCLAILRCLIARVDVPHRMSIRRLHKKLYTQRATLIWSSYRKAFALEYLEIESVFQMLPNVVLESFSAFYYSLHGAYLNSLSIQ